MIQELCGQTTANENVAYKEGWDTKQLCISVPPKNQSQNWWHYLISLIFTRFLQNCEKRLLASLCPPVCPSVRTERLGSHWMDFHEIWYLSSTRKYVEKVLLKSCKHSKYLTWRSTYFFFITCRSVNEKIVPLVQHQSAQQTAHTLSHG